MLCDDCPKREKCTKLCQAMEEKVDKDRVPMRELLLPLEKVEAIAYINRHLPGPPELEVSGEITDLNGLLTHTEAMCMHMKHNLKMTYKQIARAMSGGPNNVSKNEKDVDNCIYSAKRKIIREFGYRQKGK